MSAYGRGRSAWLCAASLVGLAGGSPWPALAQGAPEPPPAAPGGAASFPAAFFAPYNPVTAADMVARVPGFDLRDAEERRGFGAAAANVLINGERPSSKTAASELLKRIPAGNVLRIELLSGTDAAADIRGQSQIVNVVVNQAARQEASTTYVLAMRHIQYSERVGWTTQASRTFALSPAADLSVDLQVPNLLGRGESSERLVNGAGVTTGSRFLVNRPQNIGVTGSATLRWRPTAADQVNINVQAAPTWNGTESDQLEALANGALRSRLVGTTEYDNNYTAEVGGDWEHRFSPGLSAKLIGLVSNSSVDQSDVFEIFTAPATFLTRTQDRTTESGERIARAQVKWTASRTHTLEFGGEGAFNFRDTTLEIVNTPRGGVPTPVPLAVSDARVEEVRAEAFVTDIWTVTPRLTLESGLAVERSRITQTGDQRKERSFNYVKPRLTGTYVLDARNTLRFSLVRDVSQLDFAEFSSSIDFINATTILGNPDLVPEKAWKSRIEWEARFAARGALTLAAFADRVEDVDDLVVIGAADAYGNIGNGSRVGVEARGTLPLAVVGLADAELRFSGYYQRTRVTDPVTGERRSFSVPFERQGTPSGATVLNTGNKDWAYAVNFRHNLPGIDSSWGAVLTQWSAREEYRRAEILRYERTEPRVDLFFETTAFWNVTARVSVNNILPSSEERTRTFFRGDRSSGVVERVEIRQVLGGPEGSRSLGLQISGRF